MSQVEQDIPAGGFGLPLPVVVILAVVWIGFYLQRPNRVAESDMGWTVIPWIVTVIAAVATVAMRVVAGDVIS